MPDVMAGLDAETRAKNVDLLLHYLASRGGRLKAALTPASRGLAEHGRKLFHSIGCVACHSPETSPPSATDVPLGDLASKTTIDELIRFLTDVKSTRPSGRMPDLRLTEKEARALAMYLLRAQIDNPQSASIAKVSRPGLRYDYYEMNVSALPDFDTIKAVESGYVAELTIDVPARIKRKRNEHFVLRYHAELIVPETGSYTLFISSDDGSQLLLDDELVIDNDGTHGMREKSTRLELTRGTHAFELRFFEKGGGEELAVAWSGPTFDKTSIQASALQTRGERPMLPIGSKSFAINTSKVSAGKAIYQSLGCASCHEGKTDTPRAKPLDKLSRSASGCLGENPSSGAVQYGLSAGQQDDLRRALTTKAWQTKLDAKTAVQVQLASHNCYACHERDGIGGVESSRDTHFTTKSAIDLGDEGRLPPPLNGVGDKLHAKAITGILAAGKHHIRARYMNTRMPNFDQPTADALTRAFVAADLKTSATKAPEFDKQKVEVGRRIVGTRGFACVTCHNVNGNRSPAIQGIDLASATLRLRPDWFRRFVKNPMAMRPGTRMPGFWPGDKSPFADLLGGSSDAQIEAVWSYLSLGKSMPPPKGVMPPDGRPAQELSPLDRPIVHRTFMKDVGPRTILCGFPENLHVAFDAHGVRMAKVWRGRFFDASGVSSGRTDKFLSPLGVDVLDLPAPAFASLSSANAAWPKQPRTARNVGGDFLGYTLDPSGNPTFRYRLQGTAISEQPLPELAAGGSILRRKFTVRSSAQSKQLHFLVWRGAKIEKVADATWSSGDVTIQLIGNRNATILRQSGGEMELLLTIQGETNTFEEVIRW